MLGDGAFERGERVLSESSKNFEICNVVEENGPKESEVNEKVSHI